VIRADCHVTRTTCRPRFDCITNKCQDDAIIAVIRIINLQLEATKMSLITFHSTLFEMTNVTQTRRQLHDIRRIPNTNPKRMFGLRS